ncbi:MAG TPA: glycosyltransferase [Candidatus Kapabacteria bacterium]|nr:glycosyltransferase [Candidatus Kapabacteria bacterium]
MSTNPIRVAQVLAGAEHGGAENFFTRLTIALNQHPDMVQKAYIRGHAHRLATLREAGVESDGFRFGGPLDILDTWRFRRALKQWKPEIVMTWMGRASQATPRGDYALVNRLGHYYNLKYYRHADYWVGITKGICQHLIDGGMPAERVFNIPNFADERPVQPLPRDSFDTPADRPLLVAAGRLHVNKGFDTLLHALQKVPDATLWLAGAGPEEAALKSLCQQLGLNDRVRFLGWRNDVTTLMKTADVFVCPSRHEGLGSIVMESWAHECPIVATRSQGPGEVIENEATGLLTDIDDVDQLAAALNRTLGDADLRDRLRRQAHAHYQAHYSKAVIVEAYHKLYTTIRP